METLKKKSSELLDKGKFISARVTCSKTLICLWRSCANAVTFTPDISANFHRMVRALEVTRAELYEKKNEIQLPTGCLDSSDTTTPAGVSSVRCPKL